MPKIYKHPRGHRALPLRNFNLHATARRAAGKPQSGLGYTYQYLFGPRSRHLMLQLPLTSLALSDVMADDTAQ